MIGRPGLFVVEVRDHSAINRRMADVIAGDYATSESRDQRRAAGTPRHEPYTRLRYSAPVR